MDRFDIFYKNFKWVYRNFNGSYDFNDKELFGDTVKSYLDFSKRLPTEKIYNFCCFVAKQDKWPLIARWYDLISEFITPKTSGYQLPPEPSAETTIYGRRICRMTAKVCFCRSLSYEERMLRFGIGTWYIHKRMKKGSINEGFQERIKSAPFGQKRKALRFIKTINFFME